MRPLAILLALMAAGKVAAVHWIYRSASDDIIVSAYRPRALEACGRDAHRAFGLDAKAWSQATPVKLEIGHRTPGVYLWRVDDPNWTQHYRNPYLLVTLGTPGVQIACTYDVVAGTAATSRL